MLTTPDILELLMQGGMDIADVLTQDGEIMPLPVNMRRTSESSDVFDILTDDSLAVATETEVISTESIFSEYDPYVVENNLPCAESTHGLIETSIHLPLMIAIESDAAEYVKEEPLSADALSTTSVGSELTPLIKEELKYTIHARRFAEGKDDINIIFKNPQPEKLTKEETDKREDRKVKNKMAAQKCRVKKRVRAEALERETDRLEEKQDELRSKIEKLQVERDDLVEFIKIHKCVCPEM